MPATPRTAIAATLLTCLAGTLGGCLESEPDLGVKNQGILNGIPATGDVAVVALINRELGIHTCSGTLVAPRIVVTASHCLPPYIDESFGILEMTDLGIYFGEVVGGPDPVIGVETGKANLLWSEASIPNDIGILYLESDAPVAPIGMNIATLESAGLIGAQVRAVGYGTTGPELADNGTRMQGSVILDSADPTNTFSSANPGSVCPGDSGGSLLGVVDGTEVLIGVTSRGDCEVVSIHERVDFHYDEFIAPFIDDPFAATCTADGRCATGCADPDPDCPCAGDGMCHPLCEDVASDPDCPATCSENDGQCGIGCEFADLDCLCVEDGVCQTEACGQTDPDCVLDDGGCGCQSNAPANGLALVLLLLVVAFRRRRTRSVSAR